MSPPPDFPRPFLIVAGDAALQRADDAFPPLFRLLSDALEGFSGTVIAGGTAVGVAGVLGDIRALGFHSFKLVGVRPFATRPLYPDHPRCDLMLDTGAADFGREDAETYWKWLDGVAPGDLRMLVVGGGEITREEVRMAREKSLASAPPKERPPFEIAVLAGSGGVADEETARRAARDMDARALDPVLPLPPDCATLRQYLHPAATTKGPSLTAKDVEDLAKRVHEKYLEEQRRAGAGGTPSHRPWDQLDECLRESNRGQARAIMHGLAHIGFTFPDPSPTPDASREEPAEPPTEWLVSEEIEKLAEWEHARWTLERLRGGWIEGSDKHLKQSKCLKSYSALPDDIREYDRTATREWPRLLHEAGIQAVPPPEDLRVPLVVALSAPQADPGGGVADRAVRWILHQRAQWPNSPIVLLTPLATPAEREVVVRLKERWPQKAARDLRVVTPSPWPLGEIRAIDQEYFGGEPADWWALQMRVSREDPFPIAVPGPSLAGPAPAVFHPATACAADPELRAELVRRTGDYIGRHCHAVLVLCGRADPANLHPVARAVLDSAYHRPVAHFGAAVSQVALPEDTPIYYLGGPGPFPVHRAGQFAEEDSGWLLQPDWSETGGNGRPPWVLHQEWLDRCNTRLAALPEDFGRRKWRELTGHLPDRIAGRGPDEPPAWSRLPFSARFAHVRKEAIQEICKADHRKARGLFRAIFLVTVASVLALEWCIHGHPSPWWAGAYLLGTAGLLLAYWVCVKRAGWFENHLTGRALAEALRVQTQWNAVEIRQSVSDHFLHTHRTALAPVRRAVKGWDLLSGAHQDRDEDSEIRQIPERLAFVREGWLRRSQAFFHSRGERFERWHHLCHHLSRILLFSALAVMGAQFADWIATGPVPDPHHEPPVLGYALNHGLVLGFFALLTLSAALHAYDDRRGTRIYAQRYAWMSEVMGRALHIAEHTSRVLAGHAPQPRGGETITRTPAQAAVAALAAQRQLLLDTGLEALHETAQWILLHRDRPVEPGGH